MTKEIPLKKIETSLKEKLETYEQLSKEIDYLVKVYIQKRIPCKEIGWNSLRCPTCGERFGSGRYFVKHVFKCDEKLTTLFA